MTSKKQRARGLFDEYDVLKKLSKLQDPLEKLKNAIDFELFREELEKIYIKVWRKSQAGAKPYDYVMMLKILILQRLYHLSDEQTEYQINDRLSFRRFLGLQISDQVPDYNTIWNFRERLKEDNNEEKLFECFYKRLQEYGLIANEGKIVDASFHEVPRQRNTREENKQIKAGEIPPSWKNEPNKLSHKDTDARWTKKNNENYYGYKNHIESDTKSKLIDRYKVTDASVHDSQTLDKLLSPEDTGQTLHGDSAYSGKEQVSVIEQHKMINKVHEKGYRNRPLTQEQKENNREKSRIRVRVEHIFGFIENTMKGSSMRCIGICRAKVVIGLTNLVYNLSRSVQLGMNMHRVKCV
jgi:IS5 family transposase